MTPHADCRTPLAARRSFTLTELMVAIGIIALIATITAVSVRAVARDMKLSSATNSVVAALDNARAIAMRENRPVMVAFRARLDGNNKQYVEVVTAIWTGESFPVNVINTGTKVIDRFVPVPGIQARRLPVGIRIAGPRYSSAEWDNPTPPPPWAVTYDEVWTSVSHLPAIGPNGNGEEPLRVLAVMYDGSGTVITRIAANAGDNQYVDFDPSFVKVGETGPWLRASELNGTRRPENLGALQPPLTWTRTEFFIAFGLHRYPDDTPLVNIVPYLAVFDGDDFRDQHDPSQWLQPGNFNALERDITFYVTEHANRIHFNRYTGVVMQ